MPNNKKESLLFTCTMCFLMVFGMSVYNLILHDSFSVTALVIGVIPGFMVAFIFDIFVVGKIAKKLAFKLPINKEKMLHKIIAISVCMVTGMVFCMSLYGVVFENGLSGQILSMYITAVKFNFIVALPLQLLIVGPISRMILARYQTKQAELSL